MIRKIHFVKWCLCAVSALAFHACTDNIDTSARYVFVDPTVLSYLQDHDTAFSKYVDLLYKVPVSSVSKTTVAQLLSARGNFTCFAPSNKAIQAYLDSCVSDGVIEVADLDKVENQRVRDSLMRVIVYNSIIDGGDGAAGQVSYYMTTDFPVTNNSEFDSPNMNDRKLNKNVDKQGEFLINEKRMDPIQRDIRTTNGVIHKMLEVIAPNDISAGIYFQELVTKWKEEMEKGSAGTADYKDQLVLSRVLQACGLFDTLSKTRDEVYEMMYQRGELTDLQGMSGLGFAEGSTAYLPKHRLYGFTIFNEGDEFWASQGLDPKGETLLEDLVQWIKDNEQYSKIYDGDKITFGEDYKNPDNVLNRWVTYHILPMRITPTKLIIHDNEYGFVRTNPTKLDDCVPVYEYYTTMGPRRVIKLFESGESKGVYLNRFPVLDNDLFGLNPLQPEELFIKYGKCSNHEITCEEKYRGCLIKKDDADLDAMVNCIVYPIDRPLSFNMEMREKMGTERMRFDGMSLFPEAMTNDIRRNKNGQADPRYTYVHIPPTSKYAYFKDFWISDQTNFVYYNTYSDWCNLYQDEMKAVGRFEVRVTLPPVPRMGVYELRYDVLANGNRGIVQAYFGSDPENLPVTGIPINLTLGAHNGEVDQLLMGWKKEPESNEADPQDAMNTINHDMRNNGFMKGAMQVTDRSNSAGCTERDDKHRENSRRLLIRMQMFPEKTYYLKLRSVLESDRKEFYMDYLELCPKEVYDNPEKVEDIW